tara:strand:+ start:244 stop:414 length:171 start_codon:yes stop_codon:yes gene_type:complete
LNEIQKAFRILLATHSGSLIAVKEPFKDLKNLKKVLRYEKGSYITIKEVISKLVQK